MAVELFHIVAIETCRPRLYRAEKWLRFVEEFLFQHPGFTGRGIHVVLERVPAGEDQVIEIGQRHEFFDFGEPPLGTLAQPDRSHLGEGTDRATKAFTDRLDSGNEGGGDRAHAGNHHSQLSFGGLDISSLNTGLYSLLAFSHFTHLPYYNAEL